MMSLKPVFLWKYLKFSRNKIPHTIQRNFYLSWEDALWDILAQKKVAKGSVVLVPEFFCGDVEDNITSHGYKIAYYPVSESLQTTEGELVDKLKEYNPTVLVIFHALGITNSLFTDTGWLRCLNEKSILIEDCVHKIVDPGKLRIITKNHFIMDSLRKVVPLQGSVVYSQKGSLTMNIPVFQSFFYSFRVTCLWIVMNVLWESAQIFSGTSISTWCADKANTFMKLGYSLIGDSKLPSRGFFLFDLLQQHIDVKKIRKIKADQVAFYENLLTNLDVKMFRKVSCQKEDRGELAAYPLILSLSNADKILGQIRAKGLMLNFELNDSLWSKKQKTIYLPLGPHLSQRNLEDVVKTILKVS